MARPFDHVHEQLAQRDRLTLGAAAGEAEVVVAREPISEGDLLAPRRPRLLDHSRASHRPVEVGVGVGLGLVALRHLKPGEPAAEPAAFHSAMCWTRPSSDIVDGSTARSGQLPGVQPAALQLQRQPLAAQKLVQRRPLIPQPQAAFARVRTTIEEQVRPVLWRRHADRDYWTTRATGLRVSFAASKAAGLSARAGVGPPCQPCKWPRTDHPVMRPADCWRRPSAERPDRRLRARHRLMDQPRSVTESRSPTVLSGKVVSSPRPPAWRLMGDGCRCALRLLSSPPAST